ncbi:hypothetical protein A3J90_06005 [candidate division WOR-1 bacterium RIFOXYC2_FULL_37_10]|uniref:Uncharacterized protein n=1 Tax=candidate division WOR-1 bacterium RIFOXYB2_FULL_37_13 TaxID=1802579 RepID=A0A1F4SWE4_UNCSA|nr:MAG: hypothetical protein A2310_04640 [candidate division WOR-1 bacterium RIFOXYB2_FULL_37_13]OGC34788.1 MAG: hypothetical protein A3J90_06005 [candidate division WOR-1 bacterium RIFOXYC2_FULL_37_10]
MNNYQHKDLANGRWNELSFFEQMANIGSEVIRAISWRNKGNKKFSDLSFERALELFDLTISDSKNRKRLKEVTRGREVFVDYLVCDNIYGSDDKFFQNYFHAFNYAARIGHA